VLAPLEEPIRYNCPRCGKSLESPRSQGGQKLNCPGCGQRLQIPQPPPAAPPLNKTVLAVESQAPAPPPLPSAHVQPVPASAPGPAEIPFVELADEKPARRERCLECGRDVTGQDRLLTCPNCGSLFCSSACYRDHQAFAHGNRKRRRERREGFRCPYCGTGEPPYVSTTISSEGWVVFALLLIFCFPLFWIGLLITEQRRHCADCGARLN
jgi:lipopolysaccharide-induced tumor necrosis factor-alpha factor